jgi:hypothetical protein
MEKYYRVTTATNYDYEMEIGCFADISKAVMLADILTMEMDAIYKEVQVYEIEYLDKERTKMRRRSVYFFRQD